jgi:hypothetical protein
MKHQLFAVIAGFVLSSVGAAAQQPPETETTPTTGAATLPLPRPAAGFVQPTTPWGEPNLRMP